MRQGRAARRRPPCQHGTVACPECGHEAACRDCRRIEELNEWAEHIGPPLGVEFPGRTSAEVGAAVAEEQRRRQAQVEAIREADRQAGLAYKAWLDRTSEGGGLMPEMTPEKAGRCASRSRPSRWASCPRAA
jgi:hypothetical protein